MDLDGEIVLKFLESSNFSMPDLHYGIKNRYDANSCNPTLSRALIKKRMLSKSLNDQKSENRRWSKVELRRHTLLKMKKKMWEEIEGENLFRTPTQITYIRKDRRLTYGHFQWA